MKKQVYEEIRKRALAIFDKANIVLNEKEKETIEVADFGLDDIYRTGLQIITYVNTQRVCAKELALLEGQTCPEHFHPPLANGYVGKEETFRCRFGKVYLYVEGLKTKNLITHPPQGDEKYYSVFNQIILNPGQQYTLKPNTKHWFQAGPEGAVVSEFSTRSYDEEDVFTDPRINRIPVIND